MRALAAPADLGDPRLGRLILTLSAPAILGISAHSLQMLVSAVFVAGLGAAAVAAVAIAQSLTLTVAALGYGIGTGAASLVSRALGAGEREKARAAVAVGLAAILPVGVIGSLALAVDIDAMLRLLGAGEAVVEAGRGYAILSVIGTAVMLVHIVGGFVARAEGNAGFSMAVMVGSFGLNVVLDAVLIPGLGWGLEGAGWATLIGQVGAALAYVHYFTYGRSGVAPARPAAGRTGPLVREIVAIGLPTTLASLLAALALVLFLKAAAPYGEDAVAALGIALRVFAFGMLPVLGLCTGAQAVLGYAYGNGDQARLKRSLGMMAAATVGYGAAWSLAMLVATEGMLAPLSPDAATLALAAEVSRAFHVAFIPSALTNVALVLFQATGAPRRAAAVSLAAQGYTLIPPLVVLPAVLGFEGVVASRVVAEIAAAAIALVLMAPAWRGRLRLLST